MLNKQYYVEKAKVEKLIARKNQKTDFYNGIYDRYEYPVLTREHIPLTWRYDLNPKTNPYFMERLGINAVMTGNGRLDDPSQIYFARLTAYLVTHLSKSHYAELVQRPIATTMVVNGLTFQLAHNQPERSTGHDLYPDERQSNFDHLAGDADVAVYGHTHQQIMRVSQRGQLIINPGATGQPYSPYAKFMADQRAHYAILTVDDAGRISVDFRKVDYDISLELTVAREQQLPYLDLYEHLRRTGFTSTHDQALLGKLNAKFNYANEVRRFFGMQA